jgi:hypothetical protein
MSDAHQFVVPTGCASTSSCGVSPDLCDNTNARLTVQENSVQKDNHPHL